MKITQLEICNNIVYINNGYDIIMAIVNVLLIIFESYSYGDAHSGHGFHLVQCMMGVVKA